MIQVVHFHRRPMPGHKSVERLFADIRRALPDSIVCAVKVCPHFSKGIWRRIKNMMAASRHQGQVNHITGDVHYLALAFEKRRTLLTILDCASLERLGGWRRAVFKWLWFTLPIRRSQMVTVISEATRCELLRMVCCDAAKVRVIPCCVGADFKPMPKTFNAEEPEILHLGTAANKNLDRLVGALAGLRCRLNIVGKLSAAQTALLQESGIHYANLPEPTETELLQAYQNCDLVAFVSTYEGFGLPIVEANAVGRPVVTSNLLSMPEVAGNAACLVDPFKIESIREGILRVWHETGYRLNLVEAGFENVKRFAPNVIAEKYAALYREMAAL